MFRIEEWIVLGVDFNQKFKFTIQHGHLGTWKLIGTRWLINPFTNFYGELEFVFSVHPHRCEWIYSPKFRSPAAESTALDLCVISTVISKERHLRTAHN